MKILRLTKPVTKALETQEPDIIIIKVTRKHLFDKGPYRPAMYQVTSYEEIALTGTTLDEVYDLVLSTVQNKIGGEK
jgi:hypothetical protein